jgi:hypothetical protein
MTYFTINGVDFSDKVSSMKVATETLVSENSGRNANGDTVIDVVNTKKKVYITFRHMFDYEMQELMAAIGDYVVQVGFRNPLTGGTSVITAYTGTPEPDYYTIQPGNVIYKPMSLNFIEL